MKLLLINPNTTPHVTARLLAQARRAAPAGVELRAVTADFGPAIIGSRAENAIAGHAVLDLAARHLGDADAVLLGVSLDTALRPLREMLEVPVVGMAEAALLTACQLGGRIGALTLGGRMLPLYREMSDGYGLATRVACWRALELPAAYGADLDAGVADAVRAACDRLVSEDGVDVVVLCAAVLTGYAALVAPQVAVPVIDAIDAATHQAAALVAMGLQPHRAGSFSRPPARRVSGVGAALAARLGG